MAVVNFNAEEIEPAEEKDNTPVPEAHKKRNWPEFHSTLLDAPTFLPVNNSGGVCTGLDDLRRTSWSKTPAQPFKQALQVSTSINRAMKGPGNVAIVFKQWMNLICIDVDSSKVPDGPSKARILDAHGTLLDAFSDTYIERSQSGESYHIFAYLPDGHGLTGKRVNAALHLEAFISTLYVNMTGDCVTRPKVRRLTMDDVQDLKLYFPTLADDEQVMKPVENLPPLSPRADVEEIRKRLRNTGDGKYAAYLDGPAHPGFHSDISSSRYDFFQWVAKLTYATEDQLEVVWQIVSESWFAQKYTPASSPKNPDRFTNARKIDQMRRREIPKVIYRTQAERMTELLEHAEAKANSDAMVDNMTKKQKGVKPPPRPHEHAEEVFFTSPKDVDLSAFPVEIYEDYKFFAGHSVYDTSWQLAHAATLSHMGAFVSRFFVGPTSVFSNLYVQVLDTSGAGKEVFETPLEKVLEGMNFNERLQLKEPRSGVALAKALYIQPHGIFIHTEWGDKLNEWMKSGPQTRMIFSIMKDAYGKSQLGKILVGANYSDQDKQVQDIPDPAMSILTASVPDPVYEAMQEYGLYDGYAGRSLYAPSGREFVKEPEDDSPPANAPEPLKTAIQSALKNLLKKTKNKGDLYNWVLEPEQQAVVYAEPKEGEEISGAQRIMKTTMIENRKLKRNENVLKEVRDAARSVSENAHRIAVGLAAWHWLTASGSDRPLRPTITEDLAKWATAYSVRSFELFLADIKDDMYSQPTRRVVRMAIKKIAAFFNNKPTSSSAQKLIAEKKFKPSYIAIYRSALFKKHPFEEDRLNETVWRVLEQRGAIRATEETQKNYLATSKTYILGDNWEEELNGELE